MNELNFAAIHEAGHAVVGWVVGLTIVKIVIHADGGGRCDFVPTEGEFAKQLGDEVDAYERWACVHLAGGISQSQWSPVADLIPSVVDHERCNSCVRHLTNITGESHEDYLRRLRNRTKSLVRKDWPRIEALAQILQNLRVIPGDEATSIIESAST